MAHTDPFWAEHGHSQGLPCTAYDCWKMTRPLPIPVKASLRDLRQAVRDADKSAIKDAVVAGLADYTISTIVDQIVVGIHLRDRDTADMVDEGYRGAP